MSQSKLSRSVEPPGRPSQATQKANTSRPITRVKEKSVENVSKEDVAQLYEEVDKELYPKLILLKTLAPFKDGPSGRDASDDATSEHRRNFLDAFAYLCDIKKGGLTVTAAALQKVNNNVVLWLAANEQIRPDLLDFAKDVLERLKSTDGTNRKEIEEEILQLVVSKGTRRIKFYRAKMASYSNVCCNLLGSESDADLEMCAWIKKAKTMASGEPGPELVRFCYELRGECVASLKSKSKDEDDCFAQLAHFIGRLGAHRSKILALVTSILEVPALKNIGDIKAAESPPIRRVKVVPESAHHYDMVLGICRKGSIVNQVEAPNALHALCDLELEHGLDLRGKIDAESVIDTRVHAELILVDLFARNGFGFVDNDRYIGCSKPACYFCFNWIALHYAGYARPATHNKIILGCRGLDSELSTTGKRRLKEMNQKMIQQVERDIIQALLTRSTQSSRRRFQHMSSEGSSKAPSISTTMSRVQLLDDLVEQDGAEEDVNED